MVRADLPRRENLNPTRSYIKLIDVLNKCRVKITFDGWIRRPEQVRAVPASVRIRAGTARTCSGLPAIFD